MSLFLRHDSITEVYSVQWFVLEKTDVVLIVLQQSMTTRRKSDQMKRREGEGEENERLHFLHSLAKAVQLRLANLTRNPVRHPRMMGKSA